MTSVSVLVLAAAFLASPVLFALAILQRERPQQSGFVYSVVSVLLFFVVFCDRLPGPPDFRAPLTLLGGDSTTRHTFHTPTWSIVALLVVYGVRLLVWARLTLAVRHAVPGSESLEIEDELYDLVAPLLAYTGLVLCVVVTIGGTYHLGVTGNVVVGVIGGALYFAALLRQFVPLLESIREVLLYVGDVALIPVKRFAYLLVIALAEIAKRAKTAEPVGPIALTGWAQRGQHKVSLAEVRRRRAERLAFLKSTRNDKKNGRS